MPGTETRPGGRRRRALPAEQDMSPCLARGHASSGQSPQHRPPPL